MKAIAELGREKAWFVGAGLVLVVLAGSVFARRGDVSLPNPTSASDSVRPERPFRAAPPLVPAQTYPAAAPALRITEIYLGQPSANSPKAQVWAELYCARGPVDLAQYVLSDLDGTDRAIAASSTVLRTGEFAVVRWEEGASEEGASGDLNANGVRDLFVGGRRTQRGPQDDGPSVNIDQLVLHRVDSDNYEDAVAWTLPGRAPERWEADDMAAMIERGVWSGPALEATHIEGASWVVRDISAQDRGAGSWALAAVATPGMGTESANIPDLGSVRLTEVHPMATRKEAFAEIRATKATNLRAFVLTDLDGAASPLAGTDLTLQAGEYAIVRWTDGITEVDARGDQNGNGYRDIFLPSNEAPSRTEDVLALILGGQIYDAVAWREKGRAADEAFAKEIADLVARGTPLTPFELTGPATLLARLGDAWGVTSLVTPGATTRQVAAPVRGSVVVSEVYPAGAGSWAEIEVRGRNPVDVSMFIATDLDGRGEALARDPVTLRPGERVVVRWGSGTDEVDGREDANANGIREVYLSTEAPSATTDQLAIYFGSALHDALAWTNKDERITEAEGQDLAQLQREGVSIRSVIRQERSSVARVGTTVASHADPTPGKPNDHYLSRPFAGVRLVAFQVSSEGAWAEIEATGSGPTDISRLVLSDMDGEAQESPLSEDPILLRPGNRARIRWGKGENDLAADVKTIHLDQDPPTKSADQLVLIHHGRILEAVVFADWDDATFPHPERDDVKRLVEVNQWRARDFARPDAIATEGGAMRRTTRGIWEKNEG